MNVKPCKRCKRLFNYVTGPNICPSCRNEMEKEFQIVKKYIEENPGSDIKKVSNECEVDANMIRQWVREERLQFSDDSGVGLDCERCGAVIRSGRYCDNCKREMTNSFNSVIRSAKPAESASSKADSDHKNKMRFLDK